MTGPDFDHFCRLVQARSGIVLSPDKAYLVQSRLEPVARAEKLMDVQALLAAVRVGAPTSLVGRCIDAMATHESLFFRDSKPFDALRQRILARLHAARPAGAPLRIWSAAASTGQEAYSIAMVIQEMASTLGSRRVDILGTDIAREPLQRARDGVYSQFEIQRGLPMQALVRHFDKDDGQWRIKPNLRSAVTFREWNLLADIRPLGQFDIVFCRNVLIYFDAPTKTRVLEAIAKQLTPDGVLFLGGAETVLGLTESLRAIQGEPGAYAPAGAG